MQPADVQLRIEEWSRWARSASSSRRRRCGSAERGWRTPQCWYEPAIRYAPPINVERVMQVEHVVVALGDPWHLAVVLFYVRQMPEPVLRRRLCRWHVNVPATLIAEAERRIGERLA